MAGQTVRVVKSEPKCKLCAHEKRATIDELLLKRSLGESDDLGRRYNAERVKELFRELGVQNPTDENLKTHWRKHCEVVSTEVAVAAQEAASEVVTAFRHGQGGQLANPDEALDLVIAQGRAELEASIAAGAVKTVSVDQMMKAIEVKTRRKADDGVNNLLRQLGGGVARVMMRQAGEQPPALPPADVDAEAVEVPADG